MRSINRQRLKSLMEREQKRFVDERPKSNPKHCSCVLANRCSVAFP